MHNLTTVSSIIHLYARQSSSVLRLLLNCLMNIDSFHRFCGNLFQVVGPQTVVLHGP